MSKPKSTPSVEKRTEVNGLRPEKVAYKPEAEETPRQYSMRQTAIAMTCHIKIKKIQEKWLELRNNPTVSKTSFLFWELIRFKRVNEIMFMESIDRINRVQPYVDYQKTLSSLEQETFHEWQEEVEWETWDPAKSAHGFRNVTRDQDGHLVDQSDLMYEDENGNVWY